PAGLAQRGQRGVGVTNWARQGGQTAPPQRAPHSAHKDGSKDCGQRCNILRK
ncbi:MAG: hypothetical protein JWR65_1560, partial [Massilia sp.]|nr:hypothetical protein [Massilia sp.]